jgi:Spy/CpxP family protein refolding chaperone
MIRRLFRFTPAVLVVAAGALLMAGCRHHHCGWGGTPEQKADKVAGRLARELDLTEAQKSRLDAIKNDILARKADFTALKDGFHAEALAQVRAGSVDVDKLNADLAGREDKARELRAFLVAKFAEFHAILEPAQREKLAARMEKHHKDCR